MSEASAKYQYQWRVSLDGGESYGDVHPSKESAAGKARISGGGLIAECLQEDFDLFLGDGLSLLEILADNNSERVNETVDFLTAVTAEQANDLAVMVNAAIETWAEKHAINTTAYMFADVRNEEQIEGEAA